MAGSGWDELLDGDSCPDPAAFSDPAARAEWTWEREALARGLKELDALQAAVVTRWGNGAGLREIARELGVTVYAARRAQQEAVARLRRRLA